MSKPEFLGMQLLFPFGIICVREDRLPTWTGEDQLVGYVVTFGNGAVCYFVVE